METWSKLAQVISVVVGVVISILSFNATRSHDADARKAEADSRRFELQKYYDQKQTEADRQAIEAAKPFLELRQRRYAEAIQAAGVLANPKRHGPNEIKKAQKRFWELYWAELSMVEDSNVEREMMKLGDAFGQGVPTAQQNATYHLAHALRDSLTQSWGVGQEKIGKITR
jgi:hypothetical protein